LVVVTTRRLTLRDIRLGDLDDVAALFADDEQMRYYARPRTRQEAASWIERNLALYRQHGFGFWALELTQTAQFVGYCGIRPLELDGKPELEIGWHVDKAFWKRGLATEAASAVRDLAARARFTRLVALIDPENLASCRVAEKIGMQREATTVLEDQAFAVFATRSGRNAGFDADRHLFSRGSRDDGGETDVRRGTGGAGRRAGRSTPTARPPRAG
jgi:RimJ/RimL family protein N-acetyltransferase